MACLDDWAFSSALDLPIRNHTTGNGTPGHLTGELFAKAAGIQLRHIPYRCSAPAVTDLLGGQIRLMFDPVQSIVPQVRGWRFFWR